MDTVRSLKKDWVLSEEAFNLLLRQLDADRQCAGEKYEHLRRSLIKFFAWRGSRRPDADADEAIDRVARKLSEGERVQEIYSYTNGVARLVLLETLRDQEREPEPTEIEIVPVQDSQEVDDSERRADCFERCMGDLPAANRRVIVQYYRGEKNIKIENRRRLANELQIPLARLRIQAHRIRERLERCITHCEKAQQR